MPGIILAAVSAAALVAGGGVAAVVIYTSGPLSNQDDSQVAHAAPAATADHVSDAPSDLPVVIDGARGMLEDLNSAANPNASCSDAPCEPGEPQILIDNLAINCKKIGGGDFSLENASLGSNHPYIALDRAVEAACSRITSALQPGLTDAEIKAIAEQLAPVLLGRLQAAEAEYGRTHQSP